MRLQAAGALARLGDARGVAALRESLAEGGGRARFAAAALAQIEDAEGLSFLRRSLASKRREERLSAAVALARAGDASGRGQLEEALRGGSRLVAAEMLARLGHARGREILRVALDSTDRGERALAAIALGHARDATARGALRALVHEGSSPQLAALALARLGDTAALPALVECLDHSAFRVEAAAELVLLGARGDTEPTERLRAALASEPPAGRIAAALAVLLLHERG